MRLLNIAARLFRPARAPHVGLRDVHSSQCQESAGSFKSLERNSYELNRIRLITRRCSLENAHVHEMDMAYHEELHAVIPREDSITLAKRRLSHENLEDGLDATDLGFDAQADQRNQHAVRWGGVLAAA